MGPNSSVHIVLITGLILKGFSKEAANTAVLMASQLHSSDPWLWPAWNKHSHHFYIFYTLTVIYTVYDIHIIFI